MSHSKIQSSKGTYCPSDDELRRARQLLRSRGESLIILLYIYIYSQHFTLQPMLRVQSTINRTHSSARSVLRHHPLGQNTTTRL